MWSCKKCREMVDDTFDACWNCGTFKDGSGTLKAQRAAISPDSDLPLESQPLRSCPKCNAEKVMPGIRIIDENGQLGRGDLRVRVERDPNAMIFKGVEQVQLQACICGECGFTELYATDPGLLWSVYKDPPK